MLKSILKASVYIACLAWSDILFAAGLGGINVTSFLGQPLKAEIAVLDVDKADKSGLRVKLASPDAYKTAGIDFPYTLPKLKFQVEERASGEPFIQVTTAQPVNEPFVTLMVELSWSSGKLLREYTFLLDPVDYKPEQPKPEEVKPIEPVLAEPVVVPAPVPLAAASAPVPVQQVEAPAAAEAASAVAPAAESVAAAAPAAEIAPASAPAPEAAPAVTAATETAPGAEVAPAEKPMTEQPLAQEQAPAAAPVAQDALSKEEAIAETAPAMPSEYVTVVRGDTLTKIAAQIKPADVSLERMLVSLYRENAGVFDGHNMNRIRAGRILTIPSAEAIRMLPQADAEEEIRAQAVDWNAYRQKLAAARAPAAPREDKQEASGKISAAVTDKATVSKALAKEVLRLSKGEAPSEKAVGGGKTSAEEQAAAKEEESIARSKALKEAEERTAILEKNVQDMKRLAEMKKESAPASAPAGVVTMNAASAPQPASSAAPAKPKPQVVPPKVVEQPSLVDQLLGEPLYLAGGAALLLALGGLGFMAARRGKLGGGKKKVEEVGSTTGRIAAPVAPSPETGDFTHTPGGAAAPAAPAESEEVDPIGEADLFLTFGRDVQAEEVLKEALKKNPNNVPVKLKLLSIYVNRKDTNSFYSYAREIKESGDASAWEQTAAMGRELEPSNPFYGGTAGAAPEVKAAATAAPAVDFDLGFGAPAAAAPAPGPEFGSQSTIVMEAPSQERTAIMTSEELRTAQATPMDFDITGTNPDLAPLKSAEAKPGEAPVLNMDDLVFDVTATHPQMAAAGAPAAAAPEDLGLTFTLDFPMESKPKTSAPAPDLGLGEISLDLDKLGATTGAGAASVKDEHWQEVATKLDLAKAYQEMGDVAGAREILEEVLRDGDQQQRESAQTLMQQL